MGLNKTYFPANVIYIGEGCIDSPNKIHSVRVDCFRTAYDGLEIGAPCYLSVSRRTWFKDTHKAVDSEVNVWTCPIERAYKFFNTFEKWMGYHASNGNFDNDLARNNYLFVSMEIYKMQEEESKKLLEQEKEQILSYGVM